MGAIRLAGYGRQARGAGGSAAATVCFTTFLLLVGVAVGCSARQQGPKRDPVTGMVTYGGEPVPTGRIAFEPDESAGNTGPGGYAEITDGRYDTGLQFGAVGGPHIVRIEGYSAYDPQLPEGGVRVLFRDYTTKIDLPREKSTLDFDVPVDKARKGAPPASKKRN